MSKASFENNIRNIPGGPVVKTSPSNAGSTGSIPHSGSYVPTCLVAKNREHKQQKLYCNKFNKDVKNGIHQKHKKERK